MNANLQKGIDNGGLCFCYACKKEHGLPEDPFFNKYLGMCKICLKKGEYLEYANANDITQHFKNNSNTMKIQGTIKVIFDPLTFDSGFVKREMVVTTNEQYPQDIKVEFLKEKANLLDNLGIGEQVEVSINLRGNEYNGKYFVNIVGWRIQDLSGAAAQPQQEAPAQDGADDLPF